MEAVLALMVIAVGALVVVAVKGSNKRKNRWQEAAPMLGLSFSQGPHSSRYIHESHYLPEMFGQVDGQDVYVGVRSYTTGSGKSRTTHYYTYVDVVFDTELKRGLSVARSDGVSKFFGDVFGQTDLQIGHEDFDREFRIDGVDGEQLCLLLGDEKLRGLLQHRVGLFQASLTDSRARFEASGIHVEPELLRSLFRPGIDLFRSAQECWHRLPMSAQEIHVAEAWEQVARRNKLSYQARGMKMLGCDREVETTAEVIIAEGDWRTRIQITFNPPIGAGLVLTHEGMLASIGKFFGGQDIQTGDADFDKAFKVKGLDEGRVKAILVDEARVAILGLKAATEEISVDDDGIIATCHRIVSNEDELHRLVELACAAADAMVGFRKPRSVGPFR